MTKYLNFSEDFTEKILNGEKVATLRLGIKNYVPGEIVILRAGEREIGMAKIKEVNVKKFSELTQRDVEMDGFGRKEELIKALKKFYGEIQEDSIFTQIIFEIM